jgi:hypothetical protein
MIRGCDKIIDQRSLIPWPLAPKPNLPPQMRDKPNTERVADYHHAAEGRDRLESGDLSDRALRHARVQWALYPDHHLGYHGKGLSPILPATRQSRLRYTMFASAGYLPEQSIGVRRSRGGVALSVGPLALRDRQLMWERGDCSVEKPIIVNRFAASAIIEFGLPSLDPDRDTNLRQRFRDDPESGMWPLMKRLVQLTVQSHRLGEDYKAARSAGMMPPGLPSNAETFLMSMVTDYEQAYQLKPVDSMESVSVMLAKALGFKPPAAA